MRFKQREYRKAAVMNLIACILGPRGSLQWESTLGQLWLCLKIINN